MDNYTVDQAGAVMQAPVAEHNARPRNVYNGIWVRTGRLDKDEHGTPTIESLEARLQKLQMRRAERAALLATGFSSATRIPSSEVPKTNLPSSSVPNNVPSQPSVPQQTE